MQVTSMLSKDDHGHKHDHDHHHHADGESCSSCGHDHEHTNVRLTHTLAGLIFVLNSFAVEWIFGESGSMVSAFSGMIGAIVLGYPIVWLAIKDVQKGVLSTNELVGIAVLACRNDTRGESNFQASDLLVCVRDDLMTI